MNFNRAILMILLVAITMSSCSDQISATMRRQRLRSRLRREREEQIYLA